MADTVAGLGARLEGKVVIDATNNIRGEVMHSAAPIAAAAPRASSFRAFNTLGWELLDQPVVAGTQAICSSAAPTALRGPRWSS